MIQSPSGDGARARHLPYCLVLSIAIGTCPALLAAERAQPGNLEEVIVTGTKRDTSQQDTPIAISTLTSNQINKTFINDIRAVSDLSPNVTLTTNVGFNAVAGGIRGTGTISILTTQDPSVGLLVDEFALNHVQSQFVELYDLEQVEIYRGPQGTLFGKNSTGGVIAITSKRPDLDEFGADLRVSGGQYEGEADTRKLQMGIDVPLVQGKLGLRFAGSFTEDDGFFTNDKDTATFPNSPLYQSLGITPDQLPPELSQVTRGAGERLGGREVFASKTKLLWQPVDAYEAYFLWEVVRDESDAPPGVNETPPGEGFLLPLLGFPGLQEAGQSDPFSTGMTQQGGAIRIRDGHRVNVDGYYLNQELEFGQFLLHSNTGWREQVETLPSTYTGEAFLSLFDATRNLEREQFQQELRLATNFDGPVNLVAGGIYTTDDIDFRAYSTVGLTGLFPSVNPGTGTIFDERGFLNLDLRNVTEDPNAGRLSQDRESIAFYIDGSWDLTDRIRVSAGTRWTKDEKEFVNPINGGQPGPCSAFTEERDAVLADPTQPFDPVTNCAGDVNSGRVSRSGLAAEEVSMREIPLSDSAYRFLVDDRQEWTETTWRVVLDYKFTEDMMAYASVATGFLAGGYSETCSQLVTCIPFDPETNTNYEAGLKADLLDNRLRLNLAAFYTEFQDLQRNQVFQFTNADGSPGQETITLNAGESTSMGLEIETTWLITDRLQLRANLGWLDAEYDVFDFDPDGPDGPTAPVDLTGLDIPFSPEIQGGAEVNYDMSLPNGGTITWTASFHYQDEAETSPFDPNAIAAGIARHPTYTQMEERTLVNANITYSDPNDRFYVTLFGTNLFDETYRTSANSVGNLWNFTTFGAPRHVGLELGVNFR